MAEHKTFARAADDLRTAWRDLVRATLLPWAQRVVQALVRVLERK